MKSLCVLLTILLVLQTPTIVRGQSTAAGLTLVALRGEGSANNVGQRSTDNPTVRVDDAEGKPVAGASVVFTLPTEGPGGVFPNGSKTLIVTTDDKGIATATAMRLNGIPGRLQIHVNASWRGNSGRLTITQFNVSVAGKRSGSGGGKVVLAVLAVAGAAAAGGVYAATRSSGSPASVTTPPTPIRISLGAGTVGAP